MTGTVKIEFPKTDVVGCKFSFRTGRDAETAADFDSFGVKQNSERLRTYYYRLPKPLVDNVRVGDMVVVYCQTGYQVCQVTEVNAMVSFPESQLAYVVDTVHLNDFVHEVQKQKQLDAMKQRIIMEKKRLEAQVSFDMIAERNPDFAAMLKHFSELGGEL